MTTAFCAAHGVDSESEYKLRRRDAGGPSPVDARPGLEALGIRCVDEIEELGAALA